MSNVGLTTTGGLFFLAARAMPGDGGRATITVAYVLFMLLLLAGGVLLQIFLSKRRQPWPGLILPALGFLYSLLVLFNIMAPPPGAGAGAALQTLFIWLFFSIPTLLFLAIYFICRNRLRRQKQLEKMSIQDLN